MGAARRRRRIRRPTEFCRAGYQAPRRIDRGSTQRRRVTAWYRVDPQAVAHCGLAATTTMTTPALHSVPLLVE